MPQLMFVDDPLYKGPPPAPRIPRAWAMRKLFAHGLDVSAIARMYGLTYRFTYKTVHPPKDRTVAVDGSLQPAGLAVAAAPAAPPAPAASMPTPAPAPADAEVQPLEPAAHPKPSSKPSAAVVAAAGSLADLLAAQPAVAAQPAAALPRSARSPKQRPGRPITEHSAEEIASWPKAKVERALYTKGLDPESQYAKDLVARMELLDPSWGT